MASVEDSILHNLKKNGFPSKKVSLPFQPLFKACKKEETTLSDVLNKLESQGIMHQMDGDRIIFSPDKFDEAVNTSSDRGQFDYSNEMVQEAMKKMSEMDPDDLKRLKEQVAGMTPEQKNELLKQAQALFKKKDA